MSVPKMLATIELSLARQLLTFNFALAKMGGGEMPSWNEDVYYLKSDKAFA
jgi:hypothetical protein